jgi:hypothetical protein
MAMHPVVVIVQHIVVVYQSAPAVSPLDVLAQLATVAGFPVIVITAVLAWLAWRRPVTAEPPRGTSNLRRRQHPQQSRRRDKAAGRRPASRNRSPPSSGGR